jgi:xanthine dehydrogenase small subunit
MKATGTRKPSAANTLRFVAGGEIVALADIDPTMTVLNYLREVAHRTGTKEGCAEGDCGACTVVLGELGELDGTRLRYRAVNACVLFLPALDGKQLITVEDLRAPGGGLHPVQRALVDLHGSQCGFCTPGFVMSLFALYKSERKPSRARIDDVLAGNLCRCTGYRPITDAAQEMYRRGGRDHFSAAERKTVALLRSIRRRGTLALAGSGRAAGRRYFAPTGLDAFADLVKSHPDAHILAGGTDLGLLVTKQHRDLQTLIAAGGVARLRTVRKLRGGIEIGAMATYTDALAIIAAHYADFGELLRRLGSVQIRNAGTIGGNIANASPIGDTMPALMVLGATVTLRRGARTRKLPLETFFTGYRQTALRRGEFIQSIHLPAAAPGRRFAAYKISKRFDQDISAVLGAFGLALEGGKVREIRIAFGGMAATPKRAVRVERMLIGRAWNLENVEAAARAMARDFAPIGDMRASADYRRKVAGNLLRKFFIETGSGIETTRVLDRTG